MNKAIDTSLLNAQGAGNSLSSMMFSYETLFEALTSASDINTHYDFYQWLQRDMQTFLPHETLAAVWGDFASGEFHYDLASSLPEVKTSSLVRTEQLDQAMYALWQSLQAAEQNWMMVEDFMALAERLGLNTRSKLFTRFSQNVEALLVCSLRCNRGREDCLYIFSLTNANQGINPGALEILISHVDASLRRVECLSPVTSAEQLARAANLQKLSSREREVLHWVSEGKSNEEIGLILNISHNTVKNHLKRVFSKLGVSARSQAVRLYMGAGVGRE